MWLPDVMTLWPSGLRRWLKAPVRKGVGSNPTGVTYTDVHWTHVHMDTYTQIFMYTYTDMFLYTWTHIYFYAYAHAHIYRKIIGCLDS